MRGSVRDSGRNALVDARKRTDGVVNETLLSDQSDLNLQMREATASWREVREVLGIRIARVTGGSTEKGAEIAYIMQKTLQRPLP